MQLDLQYTFVFSFFVFPKYYLCAHASVHACTTVEPLYKGHAETMKIVLYREVSFIQRLNYT